VTPSLTLEALNQTFEEARKSNSKYVGISIGSGEDGYLLSEVHVIQSSEYDTKQKYYNLMYDKHLEHMHADNLRVTGFAHGNSPERLEGRLVAQVFTAVFQATKPTKQEVI
jgi:hypothetical protein